MAVAHTTQADITVLSSGVGPVWASQSDVTVVYNFPSEEVQASGLDLTVVSDSPPGDVRVSGLDLTIVYRGRTNDPRVRAWTFTLDGHDYYILRLGNEETLVYDTFSQEWYSWGSGDSRIWRAYTGAPWIGGRELADKFAPIVVGDDTTGSLYFLDPDGFTDDDAVSGKDHQRQFTRELTTQLLIGQGYSSVPLYGVQLFGSNGQTPSEENLSVSLSLSDDRGISYTPVASIEVPENEYDVRLNWRSLGSMKAPGRLFKITDTGALQRIDFIEAQGEFGDGQ